MSVPPYKVCPGCRQPSELQAPYCPGCGHTFRTSYSGADPAVGSPPPGSPSPPQQYPPPGYPPTGYPPPYQPYLPYAVPPPGYVAVPPGTHSPGLAVLFSLLLFGGGQLYNRQVAKGLTLILSYLGITLASGIFLLLTVGFGIFLLVPLLLAFIIAVSIDAYKVAERLNRGELVGQWQWF